jgi:fumarate hydratase, class II
MDATPLTLGQEFSGYATQVRKGVVRVDRAVLALRELAIGGTAVGTGLNGHPDFPRAVCQLLAEETGLAFVEAENHFEAQGARDDAVEVAGHLAAIAAGLRKVANDLRLLGSGPRAGFAEIRLAATQPGSSIMPGKVNPVMSEMLVQVCLHVQGLAQTAAIAGGDGQLELNATLPLLAHVLHEAVTCLANGARVFADACVDGIEADEARCQHYVERSLMLVTALTPRLGYDRSAAVAQEALATGRSLREVVLAQKLMEAGELDRILDPREMLQSHSDPTGRADKGV